MAAEEGWKGGGVSRERWKKKNQEVGERKKKTRWHQSIDSTSFPLCLCLSLFSLEATNRKLTWMSARGPRRPLRRNRARGTPAQHPQRRQRPSPRQRHRHRRRGRIRRRPPLWNRSLRRWLGAPWRETGEGALPTRPLREGDLAEGWRRGGAGPRGDLMKRRLASMFFFFFFF